MGELMYEFTARAIGRVIAAHGSLRRLPDVVGELGAVSAIVVTSPTFKAEGVILEQLLDHLAVLPGGVSSFTGVQQHSPLDVVTEGVELARQQRADLLVSLGGGSSVDTAKGIIWYAAKQDPGHRLRHIAIPSTLSGAEFTEDAGITVAGHKRVHRSAELIPDVVILDPDVLATAGIDLLCRSAMNAMAHCFEGLTSIDASPMSQAYHIHALRLLSRGVTGLITARDDAGPNVDRSSLESLQSGAALAAMHQVRMGVGHVLVHAMAGLASAPHAVLHGTVAPVALAFNAPYAGEGPTLIAEALADGSRWTADPARAAVDLVIDLTRALGARTGIGQLGLSGQQVSEVALRVWQDSDLSGSVRPVDSPATIEQLLLTAWEDTRASLANSLARPAPPPARRPSRCCASPPTQKARAKP
jgi:maleylacetate reductase